MKETAGTKIIKWFYGIHGPLDEYRRNEVNRIGNNIAIFLLSVNLILAFTATLVVLGTNNYELALDIVVDSLLFIIFATYAYICYELKRHHLADIDVEAKQVTRTKKKIIKKAVGLGLYFGFGMYGMTILIDWLPERGALLPLLTDPFMIVLAVIEGIIFGLATGLVELHQIKIEPDGNSTPTKRLSLKGWLIVLVIIIIVALLLIHS